MAMDIHEWISFEEDEYRRTWVFDATFLRSSWHCIYGQGCQGVLDADATEDDAVAQAQVLRKLMVERGQQEPLVVNLMVSYEAIVNRLSSRRTCPKCHEVYNLKTKKPAKDALCDADATPLVQRSDDREDAIRERLVAYELLTAPLIEFYRKSGRLVQLDGEQQPEKITEDLGKVLAGQ